MSENPTPLSSRRNPAEEAVRETRHLVLRELLGAYADRELPPETVAQIDAHLIGCVQCRRELDVHESIRGRLAVEPPAAPSSALRARIAVALDAAPLPAPAGPEPLAPVDVLHRRITWLAVAGWVVAIVLSIILGARTKVGVASSDATRAISAPVRSVPMLDAIVSDYARVAKGDLPGRARDLSAVRASVSFPIEPLRAPALRLLAAWTTDVRGEPAAVLAYRLEDRLVVQYIVAEDVFFRHPAVRAAVADHHLLVAADSARSIAAWPEAATGTVLVGAVPAASLQTLWQTEKAR